MQKTFKLSLRLVLYLLVTFYSMKMENLELKISEKCVCISHHMQTRQDKLCLH